MVGRYALPAITALTLVTAYVGFLLGGRTAAAEIDNGPRFFLRLCDGRLVRLAAASVKAREAGALRTHPLQPDIDLALDELPFDCLSEGGCQVIKRRGVCRRVIEQRQEVEGLGFIGIVATQIAAVV
jgi:hypothetical protein